MRHARYWLGLLFAALPLAQAAVAAPAGTLDPTFNGGGILTVGFDRGGGNSDKGRAMVRLPDGRILLSGEVKFSASTTGIGLARRMPDGATDNSFGILGRVSHLPTGITNVTVADVALRADGYISVAGTALVNGDPNTRLLVCTFTQNGDVASFGAEGEPAGCRMLKLSNDGPSVATGLLYDTASNIVVSGFVQSGGIKRAALLKFYPYGELNGTFGTGGIRIPFADWIQETMFEAVALAPDNNLVAVGSVQVGAVDRDFLVARLDRTTGNFDNSLFNGGYRNINFEGIETDPDVANAVQVAANGSMVIAGTLRAPGASQNAGIVRLLVNGENDTTFNASFGTVAISACDFCDTQANDVAIQADGAVVVAGTVGIGGFPANDDFLTFRLTSTGIADNTFGNGGISRVDILTNQDGGYAVDLQGSRVLVAGQARVNGPGHDDFAIIRLDHGIPQTFTINPSHGPHGQVTPILPQSDIPHSGHRAFTITPDANYALKEIAGTCPGSLIGNQYIVGPVVASCGFNVTFAADVTLTYNAGPNGSIQGQAIQVVPYGSDGTPVTAVPKTGYYFDKWSDETFANPRQDQVVTAPITVTAQFEIQTYEISPQPGANGALAPGDNQYIAYNNHTQFVVQPQPGFGIGTIGGCDGTLIGNTWVTGPALADCAVTVSFVPSNTVYSLNYDAAAGGFIEGNPIQAVVSGNNGTQVVAKANEGYVFVQWSDGYPNAARTDTHVIANIAVIAQYAPVFTPIHIVTPVWAAGGKLSPPAPQKVAEGFVAQFTALPMPGYAIKFVAGCGEGTLVGAIYTTGAIMDDCVVQAAFTESDVMYSLNYATGAGGSVQGALAQSVISGGTGTPVTAVPLPGSIFIQWSDGSTANPRVDANVIANVSVTAQFAPVGSLTVTPVSGLGGSLSPDTIQVVAPGDIIQFDASLQPGFTILGVSGCGGTLDGKVYTTGPVQASCKVIATFMPSNEMFLLSYAAGDNGTLQIDDVQQDLFEDAVISGGTGPLVTAIADPGFFFVTWSDGSTDNPRTDTSVIDDITVTAQFAQDGAIVMTPLVVGIGGTLAPEAAQVVAPGDVVAFTLLPIEGFGIGGASGCGGELVGNVFTTAPAVDSCTVEATFVQSDATYTLAYAAGSDGSLSVNDAVMETYEEVVNSGGTGADVTAVPDPGFFFVQWSDGSTDNPRVDANVVADIDVVAQFAANGSFIVTPVAGAGGELDPAIAQIVAPGGKVIFTVKPDLGFGVLQVTGCGGQLIGNLYVTGPIAANCSVEAIFTPSDAIYSLTYLAGANGSIDGDAEQQALSGDDGEPVSATPVNGHFFVQWSDGSTDNPRTDTHVLADIKVTASFAANGTEVFTVTPEFGAGGALEPPVAQKVAEGDVAQFTVKPQEGFAVTEVSGCEGVLIGNLYVTAPVTADCEVTATFEPSNMFWTLTYLEGPGGTVAGVTEQQVVAGGNGSPVEAVPNAGQIFVQWSDGWLETLRTDTNVVADIEVTAQFAPIGTPIFTVKPLWTAGGALSPPVPQQVAQNAVAQFEVLPSDGFGVLSVTGCGGSLVGNLYTTGPITGNCTVEAIFAPSNELFLLTYAAGEGGTLSGDEEQVVQSGGSGTPVTAVPDNGFEFLKWSDGSTENPRTDENVLADISVTAEFVLIGETIYTVTPLVIGVVGGTFTPDGPQEIAEGGVAVFTIATSPGYDIGAVGGTCGGDLAGNTYTTDPVMANCTVEVSFEVNDRIFYNGFQFNTEP